MTRQTRIEHPRPSKPGIRWRNLIAHLFLGLGAAVMLVPFLWMLFTSLKPEGAVLTLPPQIWPKEPTLEAYRRVGEVFPLFQALFNSMLVAILTTLGQLVLCSMSGYAFARFRFWGRDTLFYLYLATLMVPFAVTATPLFIVVKSLGWLNTYWGLFVPALFSAFGTFLMRQFFESIPKELEEAATIDGANTLLTFTRVVLPLTGSAMATLGIFAFMASWNAFLWPLLVVNNPKLMTLPLALATLQGQHAGQTEWNLVMAGTVITVAPMIVVFLLAQRWVVESMTSSGLKG